MTRSSIVDMGPWRGQDDPTRHAPAVRRGLRKKQKGRLKRLALLLFGAGVFQIGTVEGCKLSLMATAKKQAPKQGTPAMDAVLVRMLNTPPTPHAPKAPKPKKGKSPSRSLTGR